MSKMIRGTALALICAGTLGIAAPAQAGKTGKRNTAIALGAVAAYGVVKKKPVLAGVAGAGALYSYVSSTKTKSKPRHARRHVHGKRVYCCGKRVKHVHHVRRVHHVHRHRGHDDDDD